MLAFIHAEHEQGIFDAVLRGDIDFSSDPWPSISSSAKDLVKKMLRSDPKERLSAVEVLSEFYLKDLQATLYAAIFVVLCYRCLKEPIVHIEELI